MRKQVAVLLGAGSIGQAIIRRVSAGKHIRQVSSSLRWPTTNSTALARTAI